MASEKGRDSQTEARRKRLAAALRENLKRRKAQQRGRTAAASSQAPLGAAAGLGDSHEI